MSADTMEVTPPPEVSLAKHPQSKVQSSSSCCSLLCFPTCWSHSFPLFRRRWPGSSRSLCFSLNMDSPERFGASMRRNNSMDKLMNFRVPLVPDSLDPGPEPVSLPEPDFTAKSSVKRLPMGYIEPPPSVSGQQNPEEFLIYMAKLIFIM